jgi:hypothetical protein
MLFLYFRLFQRRRDESVHLPEASSGIPSRHCAQANSENFDLENQADQNRTPLKVHIQEVRSNYVLERRTFW